jgi:actin-related protein
MITTSLNKIDIDIRQPLYQHVLLSGGNTLFKGIERVHSEVKKLAPKYAKLKLYIPQNRKYSCWSGGSMITSLTSFKNMWVTRSDYTEKNENEIFFKTF